MAHPEIVQKVVRIDSARVNIKLIPINGALEISLHGTGQQIGARTYTYIQIALLLKLCVGVHVDLCRCRP